MTDPDVIQFFALAEKLGMRVEAISRWAPRQLAIFTGFRLGGEDEDEYVSLRRSKEA